MFPISLLVYDLLPFYTVKSNFKPPVCNECLTTVKDLSSHGVRLPNTFATNGIIKNRQSLTLEPFHKRNINISLLRFKFENNDHSQCFYNQTQSW